MRLNFLMSPSSAGFDEGMKAFLELLLELSRLRLFYEGWKFAELIIGDDPSGFIERTRQQNFEKDSSALDRKDLTVFSASAYNEPSSNSGILCALTHRWGRSDTFVMNLLLEFRGPHPTYGTDISLFRETIAAVIAWQRPQHVSMAWPVYRDEHHPLDKQRSGIGWLGWVPFDLAPSQVPEAAVCEPMAGGTFLASQLGFWFAAGPNKDADAIARAQALDLRLNALGVLPTTVELQRGDWGR